MKLFDKIKNKIEEIKIEYDLNHGNFEITDKGKYFFKYCEDVYNDPDNTKLRVEDYDETIKALGEKAGTNYMETIEMLLSTKFIIDINSQD